eukprot:s3007_g3.t1
MLSRLSLNSLHGRDRFDLKVRLDCGTASPKQRRASISLPLVLLPSHDASKSGVGSTPGSSGSSLKRRDSTSSLLRRRRRGLGVSCWSLVGRWFGFALRQGGESRMQRSGRTKTSTLGLLQQELAEPLKGSISRSKVPEHWLPPSDAEAGTVSSCPCTARGILLEGFLGCR